MVSTQLIIPNYPVTLTVPLFNLIVVYSVGFRGYPDGRSIRRYHNEIVLPSSAVKLDVDKMQVGALLENKLGVYILRRSQNAQSERALSVWTGDRVRHYMVFQDEKGYALDPDGVRCKTIEKLIKHFYDFTLPRCDVKLTAPYK